MKTQIYAAPAVKVLNILHLHNYLRYEFNLARQNLFQSFEIVDPDGTTKGLKCSLLLSTKA